LLDSLLQENFLLRHCHSRDYLLKMPRGRPKKVAKMKKRF